MLRKDWAGNFRRVVRDETGKPIEPETALEWSPGEIMEVVNENEFNSVKGDIGKALVEKQPPVAKPEPKAEPDQPEAEAVEKPHKPKKR